MNVKAIIREVFVELSSKGPPAAASGPPARFLPIRMLHLDPIVDRYNGRKRAVGSEGRQPGEPEGVSFNSSSPSIATKRSP